MIYLTIWLIGIMLTAGYCEREATPGASFFRACVEITAVVVVWPAILGFSIRRDIEEIKKAVAK